MKIVIVTRQFEQWLAARTPVIKADLTVLAVGDLHIENFGTWGDSEGRLCGGLIARETKALVPSACCWVDNGRHVSEIFYQSALHYAIRCPNPLIRVHGHWLVRRLSPYCSRSELTSLPTKRDEARLPHAMGRETADGHMGMRPARKAILADLARRPAKG